MLLVRRYLGAFGPASAVDIASWAGWSIGATRQVLYRARLRRFRDEKGAELLDLPGASLPAGDTPAPPRFIPVWEPMLLVHARRTQVLPEEYRSAVFNTKTPQSLSTFLVDGRVAGTWRYAGGKIELEAFAPIPRPERRLLSAEASRLAAFYGG
jgi:hypothetical protein